VGPGDEVVTTPLSFMATAEAIVRCGATPCFADVDEETLQLSVASVPGALGPETKALLPVHLYGAAADIAGLCALGDAHGTPVVEDAAQAFGGSCGDRYLGAWGSVGCLSFFPTKPLGGFGDGGMLVTDDAQLAARCRRLRVHGADEKHRHMELGGNYRLDALQAALLRVKLPHVANWQQRRTQLVEAYRGRLAEQQGLRLLGETPGTRSCHSLFTVRILENRRAELVAFLQARGIGNAVHYPIPLHLQPAFSGLGYQPGDFPNAERAASEVLSLPLFVGMTEAELSEVCSALGEFLG
jgi:dTDP-4-amino-4,6-dideoxygalactose transaminase